MSVRLWRRPDKGYLLIVADGEDVEALGGPRRYVAVHRLAAVAWGVLDGLDDPREVHHVDVVPAHTAEANLVALDADEHGRLTRENAAERRVEA